MGPIPTAAESFLGPDHVLDGVVTGQGNLRVAGRLKGNVDIEGDLTIEAGALVEGEMKRWRRAPACGGPWSSAGVRARRDPGIERIVAGMARQGHDLQLAHYGADGWRATFYPAGRAHSQTAAVGSAWKGILRHDCA